MSTTLLNIAKQLGISVSTVSRAISDPDKISEATRKRVLEALKANNYVSNKNASSLRSGKSNFIGIIISDLSDPLMGLSAMTMQEYAIKKGYFPIIMSSDESSSKEAEILQKLCSFNIAGIVICPTSNGGENIEEYASNIPIVELDRSTYSFVHDEFRMDDRAAVRMSTDYLIKKGHKKIAVVLGDSTLVFSFKERHDALRYCSNKAEYATYEIANVSQQGLRIGTFELMEEILSSEYDFTAVIACNAAIAMGVIMAMNKQNLVIGKDLDLFCLDNNNFFEAMPYPIITMQHPLPKAALEAIRRLVHRIEKTCTAQGPEVRTFVPKIISNHG